MKKKLLDLLHDIAICVFGGTMLTLAVAMIAALISTLANGFETYAMMNAVRTGLLIVGALIMFCLAGVMIGEKSNRKIRNSEKWKSLFRIVGPSVVLFLISATIIAFATAVDYIVWLS